MTPSYIISILLYILPCYLLLYLTFRDRLRVFRMLRILSTALIFTAVAMLASHVFLRLDSTLLRTLVSYPVILSGVCLFCAAASYSFWQGVFIVSLAKCYVENLYLISLYIHFTLTRIFHPSSGLRVIYVTLPLTLLTFPLACIFFKKLLRPALDYTVSLNIWQTMWIVPICNTTIHSLTISPHLTGPYFTPGNAFFFVPPFWALLNIATYTIMLRMIISMSENAILQETLHLSEIQITAQKKQLNALQHHIEQTNRSRHDMRHHILAIKGLLENQDSQNLEKYLLELTESMPVPAENYCGNSVINALLCHYRELAESEAVHVSFSASLMDDLPFSDTDLCIILGNFLENAVEACRRMTAPDKYINLKISMPSRRTLVIIAENSYEGIIRRTKDGDFLSSKEKNRKGIGIASVINVIEKYNGIPRFEYQEPVFKASLLLNAKEQPD